MGNDWRVGAGPSFSWITGLKARARREWETIIEVDVHFVVFLSLEYKGPNGNER